jgi:hypothetical protein
MPKSSLVTRMETDPVYRAVIKLVGYPGIAIPISPETPPSTIRSLPQTGAWEAARTERP